jgi:hypothetical protein
MSRTRIISQNKAVFASATGWGGGLTTASQLNRVDTFSFEVDQAGAREDIREFGQLSRIGVELTSEVTPTVSLGYFLGGGENETYLGLTTSNLNAQIISGILSEDPDARERNLYVATVKEGEDAFNSTSWASDEAEHDTIGFGNVFLTSYTANFAVGEIPRVDVEGEASNVVFFTGTHSALENPSVDSTYARQAGTITLPAPDTGSMSFAVLRPQDVSVTFENDEISVGDNIGVDLSNICVQNASVEIPLARENVECLGRERGTKYLEFPIDVNVNMSALVSDFKQGSLEYVLTGTAGDDRVDVVIKVEDKLGSPVHVFQLKNAVLDSQSFSTSLDDNESVDLTFSAQIAGASTSTEGVFWSGREA